MLRNIILVAVGGALGSVARYLLSRAVQDSAFSPFPLGTMAVNVLGCLLIGVVCGLAAAGGVIGDDMKLLLTAGFCGGFTTFSTFVSESLSMLKAGDMLLCAAYMGGSAALGLLAAAAGLQITKLI